MLHHLYDSVGHHHLSGLGQAVLGAVVGGDSAEQQGQCLAVNGRAVGVQLQRVDRKANTGGFEYGGLAGRVLQAQILRQAGSSRERGLRLGVGEYSSYSTHTPAAT